MNPVRKAGVWTLDYLYAAYWQVREALFRTDADQYAAGADGRVPVLLLPGVYETWQFMRPIAERMHDRGHPVHVVTGLGRNRHGVDAGAALVSAYLEEHDLRDVVIVAHSKGGLIGKFVMLRHDPEGRVATMVAVSTPFSGSAYARYIPIRSIRAFSPRDGITLMLAANEAVNAKIVSVFGLFDPHIPGGSRLPGARNVQLDSSGHFRVLQSPQLLGLIDEVLENSVRGAT